MNDTNSYKLHETTQPALARMRSHRTNYEVAVGDLTITVLPGVWSPAYDWSGAFMIEKFPDVREKDVLEIGSGSGLISVHAARSGAKQVTSVDVNPEAVKNTALNFSKHRIECGTAFLSNGFEEVHGAFDVIVFNAPYHGCKPADFLEYACADEDYRSLRGFFHGVTSHLRPNGIVMLGFSESGDLSLCRSLIQAHHFRVLRELSEWKQGYNCMIFELALV